MRHPYSAMHLRAFRLITYDKNSPRKKKTTCACIHAHACIHTIIYDHACTCALHLCILLTNKCPCKKLSCAFIHALYMRIMCVQIHTYTHCMRIMCISVTYNLHVNTKNTFMCILTHLHLHVLATHTHRHEN